MPHIRKLLPVAAVVALGWVRPSSPALSGSTAGAFSRISRFESGSRAARSGAANIYYVYGTDGSFSITGETEVSGTITLAPAALVVNKTQVTPSWSCQPQSISGLAIRYQCIQQGVPTASTISGSGTVTIKNAFGTSGNDGTATFSFSCGQVSTKGCSGTISVKMPKLAQG